MTYCDKSVLKPFCDDPKCEKCKANQPTPESKDWEKEFWFKSHKSVEDGGFLIVKRKDLTDEPKKRHELEKYHKKHPGVEKVIITEPVTVDGSKILEFIRSEKKKSEEEGFEEVISKLKKKT